MVYPYKYALFLLDFLWLGWLSYFMLEHDFLGLYYLLFLYMLFI